MTEIIIAIMSYLIVLFIVWLFVFSATGKDKD